MMNIPNVKPFVCVCGGVHRPTDATKQTLASERASKIEEMTLFWNFGGPAQPEYMNGRKCISSLGVWPYSFAWNGSFCPNLGHLMGNFKKEFVEGKLCEEDSFYCFHIIGKTL